MLKHTTRGQDALIDRANLDIEDTVNGLIKIIEDLDDQLEESLNEAEKLRTSVEVLVDQLADSHAEVEELRTTVGSLEQRIEELEAKQ